jgi:hypothetical protein
MANNSHPTIYAKEVVELVPSGGKAEVTKDTTHPPISLHPTKPKRYADVQCVDTGRYAPFAPAVMTAKKNKHYVNKTLKEAWESGVACQDFPSSHRNQLVGEFLLLTPLLTCQDCCQQGAHFESRMIVHEDKYLDSLCDNGRIW